MTVTTKPDSKFSVEVVKNEPPESIRLMTIDELSMVGGGQDTATLG